MARIQIKFSRLREATIFFRFAQIVSKRSGMGKITRGFDPHNIYILELTSEQANKIAAVVNKYFLVARYDVLEDHDGNST